MNIGLCKKETVINFSEYGSEAIVYTCTKSIINRFDTLCIEYPEKFKIVNSNSISKTYIIPKEYIVSRSLI